MKPHATAKSVLAYCEYLKIFGKVLKNLDPRHITILSNVRKRDRIFKRAVKIMETLKREYPQVYNNLHLLDEHASLWVFLYTQSGMSFKECVHLITRLGTQKDWAVKATEASRTWLALQYAWCPMTKPLKTVTS